MSIKINCGTKDYDICTRPSEESVLNYCNDTFQVLIVKHIQLLLSVVQLVHQLVDLLTHLTIPY